ncbi:ComEA family DNA-binding protein [Bifidobacterium parmae]|uniref:Competence protein ComEA n=1 Tax=Bifidobacterium parmae TaxID=361854 RepID=A0A2N5IZD3_9BIFI|nr:helix-hairpin-helix domain-containing protein [Bifidobacterium parmae]PLS27310.1 competence protein ComEA [Bifidobacterium parmae]
MGVRHSGNENGRIRHDGYGNIDGIGSAGAVGFDDAVRYTESAMPPVPLPPVTDDARPEAVLAELSGVRGSDRDEHLADRARHGRPRLRFGATQALAMILIMVMATCASLTLLIRQAVNYAAVEAASGTSAVGSGGDASRSDGGGTSSNGAMEGSGTTEDSTSDGAVGESGGGAAADSGTVPGQSQTQPPQPADTRVDLNTATLEQLDAIPGIGPVTAQKILDHRAAIGRFSSVDQLLDVPGIGAKTLEKIRPEVKV